MVFLEITSKLESKLEKLLIKMVKYCASRVTQVRVQYNMLVSATEISTTFGN